MQLKYSVSPLSNIVHYINFIYFFLFLLCDS